MGSDTVIALLAAEKFYGAKRAVGTSIPASEHSTITSWGGEAQGGGAVDTITLDDISILKMIHRGFS